MDRYIKHAITIDATPAKVWQALTDKELIRQYMFGTETTCDWQKGSKLTYTGEYEGHKYNDGGEILEIEPEKILKHSYWSSMSGVEDIPENYAIVTYSITTGDNGTTLTVEQENSPTERMHEGANKHWPMSLQSIKELVEKL